ALYDHNFAWNKEAERTIGVLKSILGDVAKEIEHVGSTAINSIKAKPIIDIAVAVSDFTQILSYNSTLEAHGFYYRFAVDDADNNISGEVDFAVTNVRQLLYACGGYYDGTNKLQTHFIHVVKVDSTEWRNYIKFRDCLNADPRLAKEYENLKQRLCTEFADDRNEYTARKHEFIERVVSKD
ncbi:MAG: GrpB family protein, partial [Clostridiales bacterium]|nr:GrpB family protein [Clostridiales bacterium]